MGNFKQQFIKGSRCSNVTTFYRFETLPDTKLKLKNVLKPPIFEPNGCPWYQKSEFSSQIAWQAQIDAHWAENTSF